MDYKVEADIVRSLGQIINNGHFHQGAKPVYWCTDCESALAEAEVEYQDRETWTDRVLFQSRIRTNQSVFGVSSEIASEAAIAIWTTTPGRFRLINLWRPCGAPYVLAQFEKDGNAGH